MAPGGSVGNIDSWGVGDGPLSLKEGNNVEVLFLHGYLYGRLVEVVEQGGIGKTVDEVLDTAVGALAAGKEQCCLTLWMEGNKVAWSGKGRQSSICGKGRHAYILKL